MSSTPASPAVSPVLLWGQNGMSPDLGEERFESPPQVGRRRQAVESGLRSLYPCSHELGRAWNTLPLSTGLSSQRIWALCSALLF